jgi:L-amino acid N-acyltransferase YncA
MLFAGRTGMEFTVEAMKDEDWAAVGSIYLQGIATANATFETKAPEWERWNKSHMDICRLVARSEERVAGWAALSAVSDRKVYSGVCEISIYVKDSSRGKGMGKALLAALIRESECNGIWTLQAMVFPENAASVALLKNFGFRQVGYRERIGRMKGIWRNVVLWERRSQLAGI